ncbi:MULTISPECIES: hypothetical protein [Paenibacillus]|uniref:Uncharacterized protein n=1 Tax=Paenibacillus alba TaxID=1197127 RepID=A0ABU6GD63_9BACL|nr:MULTISPECIES: hypothetical protein [Paenibacillus]MEC0232158.1 hypothetical protein [Paenibacillus alba]NQX71135.1 hypothetical protein [Paenibacillus alba]
MKHEHFECMFDSVLTDVVKQTYSNLSLPSSEQIKQSMKKMMDIIEADARSISPSEN